MEKPHFKKKSLTLRLSNVYNMEDGITINPSQAELEKQFEGKK